MTQRKTSFRTFIVFFVHYAAVVVIGIAMATSGCASALEHAPHESVRGQPEVVKQLHNRMALFVQGWYWRKSEKAFWTMVSRNGPLDRIADRDVFFSAFTKPLDDVYPGDRDMSAEPFLYELAQTERSRYELLNSGDRSFVIARLDLNDLSAEPGFHVHAEQEDEFFTELPSSEHLLVGYGIQGDGYVPLLVAMIWVRESGTWMVWNILVQ